MSARELVLMPGVAQAVRRLNDAGLPVILISNQQGVGKGMMTMAGLLAIEERMQELLREEAAARIDRCYYCTDLASANSPRRKPEPGMLLEAAHDLGLPLGETVFAGDSPTDIQAGSAAGVGTTILLLSGGTPTYTPGDMTPAPDRVFSTLPDAVNWILK